MKRKGDGKRHRYGPELGGPPMFRRVSGYYNAADIRYNVVRYPDGKVIAENLAATEKTESMAGIGPRILSVGIICCQR